MAINPATGTTWSAKGSTTSTAELRALGQQFSAALAPAGMVKTSDTGQIDWTVVNWASGTQTWGYDVWRFNDALQATKPVFLRLVYSQLSSGAMLNITAQVGTATDGAGNLTSAPNTNISVTSPVSICASSTSTNTSIVSPWYIYGDGSSLVIASSPDRMVAAVTGYGGLFSLERVRHLDGSPLGDAVTCMWVSGVGTNVTTQTVMLNTLYAQPAMLGYGWFPMTNSLPSGVVGTNMYVFPWFTGASPRLGAPSSMIIGHYRTDISVNNIFTCDHYGSSRTFVSVAPPVSNYVFCMNNVAGQIYPAIRIT